MNENTQFLLRLYLDVSVHGGRVQQAPSGDYGAMRQRCRQSCCGLNIDKNASNGSEPASLTVQEDASLWVGGGLLVTQKIFFLQPRQSYNSSIRDERYHQTGLGRKRKRRQRIGCGVPVHLVYFMLGTNNVTRRSWSKPKYNNGYRKRNRLQQPSGRFRFICATSAIYNFEQLSPIFS